MIFFLYGPDVWRKKRKWQGIRERFKREVDGSAMNMVISDGDGIEEDALHNILRAAPFLGKKRLVVLKNVITQSRRKAIPEVMLKCTESLPEHTTLVVVEDQEKPKTWKNQASKALWEYLEKNSKKEEFKLLWGLNLEKEIEQQAEGHGLALDSKALSALAIICAGDLGQTEKDLEKLTAYCAGRTATIEDVKKLCLAEGEANIFEFLDALGNKDKKNALRLAQDYLLVNDPLALLARASSHLRAIHAMKIGGPEGIAALKLHPFQAKKIQGQTHAWEGAALRKAIAKLMSIDYKTKQGLAADPKTQLTAFLGNLG